MNVSVCVHTQTGRMHASQKPHPALLPLPQARRCCQPPAARHNEQSLAKSTGRSFQQHQYKTGHALDDQGRPQQLQHQHAARRAYAAAHSTQSCDCSSRPGIACCVQSMQWHRPHPTSTPAKACKSKRQSGPGQLAQSWGVPRRLRTPMLRCTPGRTSPSSPHPLLAAAALQVLSPQAPCFC